MTEELKAAWLALKESSDWECENHSDFPGGTKIIIAFEELVANEPEGFLELVRQSDIHDLEIMLPMTDTLVLKDPGVLPKIREAMGTKTSEDIENSMAFAARLVGIDKV